MFPAYIHREFEIFLTLLRLAWQICMVDSMYPVEKPADYTGRYAVTSKSHDPILAEALEELRRKYRLCLIGSMEELRHVYGRDGHARNLEQNVGKTACRKQWIGRAGQRYSEFRVYIRIRMGWRLIYSGFCAKLP
jgi:hypothetical protein